MVVVNRVWHVGGGGIRASRRRGEWKMEENSHDPRPGICDGQSEAVPNQSVNTFQENISYVLWVERTPDRLVAGGSWPFHEARPRFPIRDATETRAKKCGACKRYSYKAWY